MYWSFKKGIFKVLFIFNVSFFYLTPYFTQAQEYQLLTLPQVINLSIKNSHQLKASLAKSEQANAALKQAQDARLPNASISGSYVRIANPTIHVKTDAFGGGSDSTGSKSFPSVNQALYGIASVSYPILTGGKIKYGIASSKYLSQAVLLDVDKDRESVILNTINAYVNVYKADVTVKVVKENLIQSTHRDSVFARLEENGIMARNDLLKAELQTSNISLTLLDAENNAKLANINMAILLGLATSTIFSIDSTVFEQFHEVPPIGQLEQMALQNRRDIQALSSRQKAAVSAISLAKSDLYPTVALTGGYIAADIPHFISIVNAVNVGVGIQYNLGSLWKNKANVAQAQAKEREVVANQFQLEDAIRLQINYEVENYYLSRKKIDVYIKAVVQAEENFRITKNKYDNALVNTTDVLDANVLLLQSKINLAVAKADVYLSYCKLMEATGTLSSVYKDVKY